MRTAALAIFFLLMSCLLASASFVCVSSGLSAPNLQQASLWLWLGNICIGMASALFCTLVTIGEGGRLGRTEKSE